MTTDEQDEQRMRYLANRAALSKKLGKREVFSVADAWPLYAGMKNLRRCAYIMSLLGRIERVPGDLAEFGCWRGATTSLMAKFMADTPKMVYGFDTFEGFDKRIVTDKKLRSNYKGNRDELLALLAQDGLLHKVDLIVGDICETVREREGKAPLRLSFAYIDCDVYLPVVNALEYVHARLSPGGIIAFDEFNDPAWPGETQAANEFLDRYGFQYAQEATPVPQPSLVLVRR